MKKYPAIILLALSLNSCIDNNLFPLPDSENRILLFEQTAIGSTNFNRYILFTDNPARRTFTSWRDTVAQHYRRYYHDNEGKTIALVIDDFDELNNVMIHDSMVITRRNPNSIIVTGRSGFKQQITTTQLPNGGQRIRVTSDDSPITFKHYNYNNAGQLDSTYYVQDLGNGVVDHQKDIFDYDASGAPLKMTTYMWHAGDAHIFRRTYLFTRSGSEEPVLMNLLRFMTGPDLSWMNDNRHENMGSLFVHELSDRMAILKGILQTLTTAHERLDLQGNVQEDLGSFIFQLQSTTDGNGRLTHFTRTINGVFYQDARYTYYR